MKRFASTAVAFAILSGGLVSYAGETAPAEAACEVAKDVGRVKCTIRWAHRGAEWADLSVIRVPEGVSALRGRLGLSEAESRDDARVTWSVALVAKRAVEGEVLFRLRSVGCTKDGRCTPEVHDVPAMVSVGR